MVQGVPPSGRHRGGASHASRIGVGTFEGARFELDGVRRVHEVIAVDVNEYIAKVSTRADSSLTLISDAEFEAGFAELKEMAKDASPEPVIGGLDLAILR